MKKILNKKGFALVETLIAAVAVISIFTLLYNLVFPLAGSSKASQNYDDLDSKYIAFYLKEMLETDSDFYLDTATLNNKGYLFYKTYGYVTDENGGHQVMDVSQLDVQDGKRSHVIFQNQLCDSLSKNKNNSFICNRYIEGANITRIYLTNYETKTLKDEVKKDVNKEEIRRSFKKYVDYLPTHSLAADNKKDKFYRIIVEIEHEAFNSVADKYYTYATIEVKK